MHQCSLSSCPSLHPLSPRGAALTRTCVCVTTEKKGRQCVCVCVCVCFAFVFFFGYYCAALSFS
jgi:hypothetical protein